MQAVLYRVDEPLLHLLALHSITLFIRLLQLDLIMFVELVLIGVEYGLFTEVTLGEDHVLSSKDEALQYLGQPALELEDLLEAHSRHNRTSQSQHAILFQCIRPIFLTDLQDTVVNIVQVVKDLLQGHVVDVTDLIFYGRVEADWGSSHVDDADDPICVEHVTVDSKDVAAVGVAGED